MNELTQSKKELLLWLLGLRKRLRVTGASMFPLLQEGDEVLFNPRAYYHQAPAIDDVVVALHPLQSDLKIIKRIIDVREDGRCQLQGDNLKESTDSRHFGLVLPQQLLGRVTGRFFLNVYSSYAFVKFLECEIFLFSKLLFVYRIKLYKVNHKLNLG